MPYEPHIEGIHEIHEARCAYPWCAYYHATLIGGDRWPCPQHAAITGKSDRTALLETVIMILSRAWHRRTQQPDVRCPACHRWTWRPHWCIHCGALFPAAGTEGARMGARERP